METALPGSATIAENLHAVRERIARACARSGRDAAVVTLVGVTKTVPAQVVRAALDAGLAHVGENRVQEAEGKRRELSDRAAKWHLVGHLQTNKARRAAELFDVVESVDSLRLARELDAAARQAGRHLAVYVQANVGHEPTKHGVPLEELDALVAAIEALPGIDVVGLMCIPPPRPSPEQSRPAFREVRRSFERARRVRSAIVHLSMGMSSDFEVAIEEGATEVRVGTALFGARPARVG